MKFFVLLFCCTIFVTECFSAKNEWSRVVDIRGPNGVASNAQPSVNKCVCSIKRPLTRALDQDEIWAQKRNVVRDMWERTSPVLTRDQEKMRDIILLLANSDSNYFQQIAFVNTAWIWVYLPYAAQTPQLCSFAQVINTTVEWQFTKNPQIMDEAIKELSLTLVKGARNHGNNAIVIAGCKPIDIKFRDTTCFERGLVHDIDAIWENTDVLLPSKYERIAKKLYKSSSYTDRMFATIATACASEPFLDLPAFLDEKLVHELFRLQIKEPIQPCCCEEFTQSITGSYVPFVEEAPKSVAKISSKLRSLFAANDYLPPV